jgi:formate-dependent nitrite reductase membrane component NrfD
MNLDTDLMLVIGIVVLILSVPSLLSAYAEARAPRAGAVLLLIGGVLVAVALTKHTAGYTFSELPSVFVRVVERYTK